MHPRSRFVTLVAVVALSAAGPTGVTGLVGAAPAAASTGSVGGAYQPLMAARILDTGNGTGAPKASVKAHATLTLQVMGRGGLPTSGVASVALNVTVAAPTASGYLTVYPQGEARPTTSNLNFTPGRSVPNLVVVSLSASGRVSIYNGSAGTVRLVADVAGYFVSGPTSAPGVLQALTPARILDTGNGTGAPMATVKSHATLTLQVSGRGQVPNGVGAAVLNVTAAGPTGAGYLTVYPAGQTRPLASNLNFTAGRTVANLVMVKLGTSGRVSIYNGSSGSVRLVADASAFYFSGTPVQPGTFVPVGPARVLDTGNGTGAPKVPVPARHWVTIQVAGAGGVPAGGAAAAVLNVTAAGPSASGYLTVSPNGAQNTSNLNFQAGHTVASLVAVRLRADGKVTFYNGSNGTVRVVADVLGYYLPRTSAMSWGATNPLDSSAGIVADLSCPSTTFCMVITASGDAVPFNGTDWGTPVHIVQGVPLQAISCASTVFCVAMTDDGRASVWQGSAWSALVQAVPGVGDGMPVSCATTTFCATSNGTDTATYDGSSWTVHPGADPIGITSISCPTSTFCMGTGNGAALFDGATWSEDDTGPPALLGHVSCVTSTHCVAAVGDTVATWEGSSWEVDVVADPGGTIQDVSCATATFCAAVEEDGSAVTLDGGRWSDPHHVVDTGVALRMAVACAASTSCVALDGSSSSAVVGTA